MKIFRNTFFYAAVIGGFSVLMYRITIQGAKLQGNRDITPGTSQANGWPGFWSGLVHNFQHPLSVFLAQIITIIFVAKLFGWICSKIGQPTVIGEMIAGIMLGPSFLGLYFPEISAAVFPPQSLGNLQFLSQLGLILFMFIVGMELDLKVLRNTAHDAVVISHASIIIPFALGMGLSYFLYTPFAPDHVQFLSFGLFMGIAMSITAFPVLARIVQERNIHKTKLGTMVISCAAADDVTAWCILAAVIAIVKAGAATSALYTIFLAIAYILFMIVIVRPFLKRIGDIYATKDSISKSIVAIFFLTLILSSYLTEVIGIHALFGAFMAGAIMPENAKFRNLLIEKVEDIALVLLLPLFFVFTGLRTQIGLLNDPYLWKVTLIIILVAVTGKFFGSTIAAKIVGQNWKDSLSIGALMNTRGLMELVVLNIGYDLKILSPSIFAMMVLMALITTFMTGPSLDLINRLFKTKVADTPFKEINKYKVLFSFGVPESGRVLLKLANALTANQATLTAMHLCAPNDLHQYDYDEEEKENFIPVAEEAEKLKRKITTLFKVSQDIETDIIDVANKGNYDLLLIGLGQSIFEGSLLGKVLGFTTRIINPEKLLNTVTGKENLFDSSPLDERTRLIIAKSNVPVGILVDKNFNKIENIFLPIFDISDNYLINYAQQFINNAGARVVIMDVSGQIKIHTETKERIKTIGQNTPEQIKLVNQHHINKTLLSEHDLMLISLESWKKQVEQKSFWLPDIPSTLIIDDKKTG